jgi:hypothetical protein
MLINKSEHDISSIVKDIFLKNINDIRYERKIKLTLNQSDLFEGILESIGMHEEFKPRKISSIYFDDAIYSCAQANLNGDRYRFKTRVRWYDNILPSNLEIKFKDGYSSYKLVEHIQIQELPFLDDKINLEISNYIQNFLFKNFNLRFTFKTTKIDFLRKYYINRDGIRATIDTSLQCAFFENYLLSPITLLPFELIEFKYPSNIDTYFRETFLKNFYMIPLRFTKCSKYTESILAQQRNL